MAIILFFAAVAVGKINLVPSKLQAVFENIVTIFSSLTKDMGEEGKKHTPLLMTLFLLIITGNLIGQIPWKILNFIPAIKNLHGEFASPTNDINVTAGLAIIVLLYYIISGVRVKGISYFKHYFQPIWFMTPFNILEDFVRPLTLALVQLRLLERSLFSPAFPQSQHLLLQKVFPPQLCCLLPLPVLNPSYLPS